MNLNDKKAVSSHQVPGELVHFIKTGTKFIIAGHKEPDGDCVGSQLVLKKVLLRMGKEVILCSAGPFMRTELKGYDDNFLSSLSEEDKADARLIIVDCSSIERTGSLEEHLKGLPCAIIDHHAAGNHLSSSINYIDASSPSCTLLILKLISALGMEMTPDEATLLLFGLCTDTGFFRHMTEKNAGAFEDTALMVRSGASPKHIYNVMHGGKSLNSRLLLGRILTRIESHFNGKLLLSYEELDDFTAFGYQSRDSDSLIKLMQSVEGVEAMAIIRQESEDECTVSLRSVDHIDVAKIASSLGGGGHKNASGLTMKGNISTLKNIILDSFTGIFNL